MTKNNMEPTLDAVVTQILNEGDFADQPPASEQVTYRDLSRAGKIKRQFMLIIGRGNWTVADEAAEVRHQMDKYGPESFSYIRSLESSPDL